MARRPRGQLDHPFRSGYSSPMRTATITETKNNLSALLDVVKGGETILILDRGRPVARLESAIAEPTDEGRLERLERQGLIRRGRGGIRELVASFTPLRLESGASVVEALLEERRSGY